MATLSTSTALLVLLDYVMIPLAISTCFTSRHDVILQNHVIYSKTLPHISECWESCKKDDRCQSLNYLVKKLLCQINNRTIDLAPNDTINMPFASYFDNIYRAPVGTTKNTPAVSCAEILKSVGNVSGRYWLIDHAQSGVPFKAYCNMTTLEFSFCSFTTYCQNGGTCVDKGDSYTCRCARGFNGGNCERDIGGSNVVQRRIWRNVNPGTISQLFSDSRYPDNPTSLDYITVLETRSRKEQNYGQTLTTHFKTPETGSHVFYMACDDQCQLLVSSDTNKLNARRVINIRSSTNERDWDGRSDQRSPPIRMVKAQLYYLHVMMTQGSAADHLSVGVRFPSGKYARPLTNQHLVLPSTTNPVNDNGWILIARFSNSDAKNWMSANGSWWYDITSAQGDTTSKTAIEDMISPAFWTAKGHQIKITRTDDPDHTGLLVTTSNCLGGQTFRSKITSYGDFRNGAVWASHKCLGSCQVTYGGDYKITLGFEMANCDNGTLQSRNKIGFWCDYHSGDGAVMMIGGGGTGCERADHGLGVTEEEDAKFGSSRGCDFGHMPDANYVCKAPAYALNLWIK